MARIAALLLFLVWAGLVVWGFHAFQTTAPTDSGFTRGFNRVAIFFQWQGLALLPAIVLWLTVRRALPKGALRFLATAPLMLSGGFFLLVILLFGGAIVASRLGVL